MVATCLAILIDRVDKNDVTIAVDGTVYEKHPSYKTMLEKYLKRMTKRKVMIIGSEKKSKKSRYKFS